MEERRSISKILVDKRTGKRYPRHTSEDNVTTGLKTVRVNMKNWVDSTQDRDYWKALAIAALNLWAS